MKLSLLVLAAAAALLTVAAPAANATSYVRGRVIVGYEHGLSAGQRASVARTARTVGGRRLPAGGPLGRGRGRGAGPAAVAPLRAGERGRPAGPNHHPHAHR